MNPRESNVYQWMMYGAFIGLLLGATHLKYTWGSEDIGSVLGGFIGGGFIGGIIARVRNSYNSN